MDGQRKRGTGGIEDAAVPVGAGHCKRVPAEPGHDIYAGRSNRLVEVRVDPGPPQGMDASGDVLAKDDTPACGVYNVHLSIRPEQGNYHTDHCDEKEYQGATTPIELPDPAGYRSGIHAVLSGDGV